MVSKMSILFFVGLCGIGNVSIAQADKKQNAAGYTASGKDQITVFALNRESLATNKALVKKNDPKLMAAYKQLIKDADKALQFGPVSVMEKKNMPPSGDKHDYMSLAPYHWPDPTK